MSRGAHPAVHDRPKGQVLQPRRHQHPRRRRPRDTPRPPLNAGRFKPLQLAERQPGGLVFARRNGPIFERRRHASLHARLRTRGHFPIEQVVTNPCTRRPGVWTQRAPDPTVDHELESSPQRASAPAVAARMPAGPPAWKSPPTAPIIGHFSLVTSHIP